MVSWDKKSVTYILFTSLTHDNIYISFTCQWRPNEQRDTLHDSKEAKGWGKAAHLHYIHEDGKHQGAHHAHGKPVDHHVSQQYMEAGPDAADAVTEPIDKQSCRKHVNVSPFEPWHVKDDAKRWPHHDVDDPQDGQQVRSLTRLHVICCGVGNQIHQRYHKPEHRPRDADGVHAVAQVIAELIEGHVFAQES